MHTLKSTIPDFSFKVKNFNKSKSKLYFSDPKVHRSMIAILRTKNIHFYSRRRNSNNKHLLYGVEILILKLRPLKENLTLLFLTVASETKFKTPRPVKQNVDTGLFLVSFLAGKSLSNVSNINGLKNQVKSWEKPKRISRNCNSA